MLISDTKDVFKQQEFKIARHLFKIELKDLDPPLARGSSIHKEGSISNHSKQIRTNEHHSNSNKSKADEFKFLYKQEKFEFRKEHCIEKSQNYDSPEHTIMSNGSKSKQDSKDEGGQNFWKQSYSSLGDNCYDEKKKTHNRLLKYFERDDGCLSSSKLIERNPLRKLEHNILRNFTESSDGSKLYFKPQEKKMSRFDFGESFEYNSEEKTIPFKDNKSDIFLNSSFEKERKNKSNDIESFAGYNRHSLKKVKKSDDLQDHRAHDKIEKVLKDVSPEPQPFGKKTARRKRLFIDDDDDNASSSPKFGGSQEVSSETSSKGTFGKTNEEGTRNFSSANVHAFELKSEVNLQVPSIGSDLMISKQCDLSSRIMEDDDNKSAISTNSQILVSPSILSYNQLKRLKKLVVDKREAATKHSVEKFNFPMSPIAREICSVCLCNISNLYSFLNKSFYSRDY